MTGRGGTKLVHVRLSEWARQEPGTSGAELFGLRLDDSARRLARELSVRGILEIDELHDGIRIASRAHVGRVRIGPLLVTVEPKVGANRMLQLLRYAYGLRDLRLFERLPFATTGELLQDLLCHQLYVEVGELQWRGLARKYVSHSELLSSPCGRIDISDLARRSPLREARLGCRHHERSLNHLLNRVVHAGVRHAVEVAQDAAVRRGLAGLQTRLAPEVGAVELSPARIQEAHRHIDRLTTSYEPALRLIELLLQCTSLTVDEPASGTQLRGFLFDMNRFFQTLLHRFLSENLPEHEVRGELALTEMMRYLPGHNPRGRRDPRPRPDFQVTRGQELMALLDAKYRDLWEHDLPRDMLYQLAIYALSQSRGATAAILFPTTATRARESRIEIRDPAGVAAIGYVALRPVIIDELLSVLQQPAGSNPRRGLAETLAFGVPRLAEARAALSDRSATPRCA